MQWKGIHLTSLWQQRPLTGVCKAPKPSVRYGQDDVQMQTERKREERKNRERIRKRRGERERRGEKSVREEEREIEIERQRRERD